MDIGRLLRYTSYRKLPIGSFVCLLSAQHDISDHVSPTCRLLVTPPFETNLLVGKVAHTGSRVAG